MPEAAEIAEAVEDTRPGRFRALYLLPVVLFVGLAALFAFRLAAGDPSRLPSAFIGRAAPNLALPPLPGLRDASGQPMPGLADAALKAGRVSVVNVWASWCGPCRIEHPLLMELGRDPAIQLLGMNYKDNVENARRFLGALGNPFSAVGQDENGRTAIEWGVYGVPETFVIGPDGTIRYKQVGPLTADSMPAFLAAIRTAAKPRGP